MLRITTQNIAGDIGLFVEGRLAGDSVSELQKCWQRAEAGELPVPAVVDLTNVCFIDEHGKQLLTQMHQRGIKLIGNGLMSKFVIDEIEQT